MMEHPGNTEDVSNVQGNETNERLIQFPAGALVLSGYVHIPENAHGMVLLAHGSSNNENERYNDDFAPLFHASGLATLSVDLIPQDEDELDRETRYFRDNVSVLSQRMIGVAAWLTETPETQNYSIGYFGVGTVAAAALVAAAERPDLVHAIVSCAGRVELAHYALPNVLAPTLFIVGEQDNNAVTQNQQALAQLPENVAVQKNVETIANAAQLLPEKLQEVAQLANQWFERHLVRIV